MLSYYIDWTYGCLGKSSFSTPAIMLSFAIGNFISRAIKYPAGQKNCHSPAAKVLHCIDRITTRPSSVGKNVTVCGKEMSDKADGLIAFGIVDGSLKLRSVPGPCDIQK